jgi:hypothetical protein
MPTRTQGAEPVPWWGGVSYRWVHVRALDTDDLRDTQRATAVLSAHFVLVAVQAES